MPEVQAPKFERGKPFQKWEWVFLMDRLLDLSDRALEDPHSAAGAAWKQQAEALLTATPVSPISSPSSEIAAFGGFATRWSSLRVRRGTMSARSLGEAFAGHVQLLREARDYVNDWLSDGVVFWVPSEAGASDATDSPNVAAQTPPLEADNPKQTSGRRYWAQRIGHPASTLDVATAARLFASVVESFEEKGYLQKWFGFACGDEPNYRATGLAGSDEKAFVYRRTRLEGIWPIQDNWQNWDRDTLLTAVEFTHDHVAKPLDGRYHDYQDCGWHYSVFDDSEGSREYRMEVNALLRDLEDGFELQAIGEVVRLAPSGLEDLLNTMPPGQPNVQMAIASAVRKYRQRTSTQDDQMDAVRDLAALLESLRAETKKVLASKDDDAIFELLNKFAVRHLNSGQYSRYDRKTWIPWMFYFLMASLHASLELLSERAARQWSSDPPSAPLRDGVVEQANEPTLG